MERLGELDRRAVRQSFEDRFTVDRMARDYIALFEHLVAIGGGSERMAVPMMAEGSSV